jgi:general secretion pathway protein N
MKRIALGLGFAAVALAAVLATVLVVAPAQWVAAAVDRASDGHLLLADARGTLWRGDATLVVAAGRGNDGVRAALPDRLSWQLAPAALATGGVELTVAHPSALNQPLTLRRAAGGETVLGAATLRLPAALLSALGAPWNTVRPGGTLVVGWDRLILAAGFMQGNLTAEWQYASSALTAVAPIGHYRLTASGGYPGTQLQLTTVNGALQMAGAGTIGAGGQVRFRGSAQLAADADPAVRAQLAGLLSLLGKRDGEKVILNLES